MKENIYKYNGIMNQVSHIPNITLEGYRSGDPYFSLIFLNSLNFFVIYLRNERTEIIYKKKNSLTISPFF